MTNPTMADSSDKPCAEGDGRMTANGDGTDDGSVQRGCAPAESSVDGRAEHHDSNQNGTGHASASSGPNPPASENGNGEAPTAEVAPDEAKLDETATGGGEPGTAVAAKKKKKKGGKNSKAPTALNKIRGTGFEGVFFRHRLVSWVSTASLTATPWCCIANFADPPMTPAEYQEEQILYDPLVARPATLGCAFLMPRTTSLTLCQHSAKNTFVEYVETPHVQQRKDAQVEKPSNQGAVCRRIEEGIRRFRGRRRMDPVRTYMFDRYLNLGGIDTSQRQFQGACGLAGDALDQLSANERRVAASNDVIHRRGDDRRYYDPEEEGWHVDFTGVVSCYL